MDVQKRVKPVRSITISDEQVDRILEFAQHASKFRKDVPKDNLSGIFQWIADNWDDVVVFSEKSDLETRVSEIEDKLKRLEYMMTRE